MATFTRSARHVALQTMFRDFGYHDELTESAYPVWTNGATHTVDLVGFGRPLVHDMTTATVTGLVGDSDADIEVGFRAARALATPALLIALPDRASLWSVDSEGPPSAPVLIEGYERFGDAARRLTRDLSPTALLAAKSEGRQLSLFPLDVALLSSARAKSSGQLAKRVDQAVSLAFSELTPDSDESLMPAASRLVIAAMAALMVRDKLSIPVTGPAAVLEAAHNQFAAYFSWLPSLTRADREVLLHLIAELGEGLDYRGLDPAIVSDVYEHAVIDRATRKALGAFYTPPELARKIARHTPFEEIAPEERIVLDLACGSGTLLLAAQERLLRTAPSALDESGAHKYVTSHLLGFDADEFAVEIARLSLLLNALPIGDSWRIEQRSLHEPFPQDAPRPSVVLSNPPWQMIWSPRKGGRKRTQVAEGFLRSMLDLLRPGGFLSVVLPGTFFDARSSREIRRDLLASVAAFEVWRLPEDTFTSHTSASVLFAQANGAQGRYVFRRPLKRKDWKRRFFADGEADEQRIVLPAEGRSLIHHGPLDDATHLAALPKLSAVALVRTGPVPTPGYPSEKRTGSFLWLPRPGRLQAFADVPEERLVQTDYPEGFNWRADDGSVYLEPKVLLSAVRGPENPWRVRVGLDLRGVIPRQSLFMAVPRDPRATIYALEALLASSTAACWIDTYNVGRSIRQGVIESMPVPVHDKHWRRLDAVGLRCRKEVLEHGAVSLECTLELEDVVGEAYGLDSPTREATQRHLAGFAGPEDRIRFPMSATSESRGRVSGYRYFGTVLDVDQQRLRLWVPGLTQAEGEWVSLPPRLLGRQTRPGATFEVLLAGTDLREGQFEFQPHSHLDLDELLALESDS